MKLAIKAALVCAVALLAGCHQEVIVPRMGFIPMEVPLAAPAKEATESTYLAPGFDPRLYSSAVIEPVQMYPGATYAISAEDAATVQQIMTQALVTAFGLNAVRAPSTIGPRTLVVHCALTEIRPNKPMLNIAPQTQMRGRGYGYASVEIYIRAGADGPIVAALMSTANTQRFSAEKLTPMGTADEAARQWAQAAARLVKQ